MSNNQKCLEKDVNTLTIWIQELSVQQERLEHALQGVQTMLRVT